MQMNKLALVLKNTQTQNPKVKVKKQAEKPQLTCANCLYVYARDYKILKHHKTPTTQVCNQILAAKLDLLTSLLGWINSNTDNSGRV